jgi:hypothetical protein
MPPARKKHQTTEYQSDSQWQDLLNGKLTLVGIDYQNDRQIPYASFCYLENWSQHHEAPQEVPMFRYLQNESKYCKQTMLRVPVSTAVQAMREYDATHPDETNLLEFKGALFHESRVGSTLIANILASLPNARVYSESRPPVMALTYMCQNQSLDCTHDLVTDVVYIMRRVSRHNPAQYMFWKFQSAATWQLETFERALPNVPWIFVYRDPVQVMVSHFQDSQNRKGPPKCAQRQRNRPPPIVVKLLERSFGDDELSMNRGNKLARAVSVEQYCAAHLASLADKAVSVLQQSSRGRAVNYELLPDLLWNDLLPNHFQYNASDAEIARMQEQARVYSKGVVGKTSKLDKVGIFESDSQRKEQAASTAIKLAAQGALQESYAQLEALSRQTRRLKKVQSTHCLSQTLTNTID